MQNGRATLEKSLAISYKTNHGFTVQSSNCILLDIYPSKLKTYVHTKTCTWTFIAALFIITKTWKQPRHSLVGKWINKLRYTVKLKKPQLKLGLICRERLMPYHASSASPTKKSNALIYTSDKKALLTLLSSRKKKLSIQQQPCQLDTVEAQPIRSLHTLDSQLPPKGSLVFTVPPNSPLFPIKANSPCSLDLPLLCYSLHILNCNSSGHS